MNETFSRCRLRMRFVAVLLFAACINAADAGADTACEIISADQAGAIVGAALRVTASGISSEDKLTRRCTFEGGKTRAEISLLRADNEHAAVKRYALALRRAAGDSPRDEPLHGVGVESRYRATEKGSTIIARFGVHVVVVSTNAGRQAAVGLARAVEARLSSS